MELINEFFVILGESHWAVKLRQEFVNNLFIEFVLNQDQKTKLIEVVLQVCVRNPTSIPLGSWLLLTEINALCLDLYCESSTLGWDTVECDAALHKLGKLVTNPKTKASAPKFRLDTFVGLLERVEKLLLVLFFNSNSTVLDGDLQVALDRIGIYYLWVR